jgi:hypothetical protein
MFEVPLGFANKLRFKKPLFFHKKVWQHSGGVRRHTSHLLLVETVWDVPCNI